MFSMFILHLLFDYVYQFHKNFSFSNILYKVNKINGDGNLKISISEITQRKIIIKILSLLIKNDLFV
jgi:hypothetical protein